MFEERRPSSLGSFHTNRRPSSFDVMTFFGKVFVEEDAISGMVCMGSMNIEKRRFKDRVNKNLKIIGVLFSNYNFPIPSTNIYQHLPTSTNIYHFNQFSPYHPYRIGVILEFLNSSPTINAISKLCIPFSLGSQFDPYLLCKSLVLISSIDPPIHSVAFELVNSK